MLAENDKQILNSVKDSLLQLGQKALDKNLLDYLFVAGGVAAGTGTFPISLPIIAGLLVAHAGINYFSGKEKAQAQKLIDDEFRQRHKEICDSLKRNRETQITELSKIIDIQLKHNQLLQLIDFLDKELNSQSIVIGDILEKIGVSLNDLQDIQEKILAISQVVKNIGNGSVDR